MISEKATINCESKFSKDHTHRYLLTKVWDTKKPLATVISIAPSEDYNVRCDLTTSLIQNNLERLDMGGFHLVNIFSKIGASLKGLTSVEGLFDRETDKVLLDCCNAADSIILAWGKIRTKNQVVNQRLKTVTGLLEKHQKKLFFIADATGRSQIHPLTPALRKEWYLVEAIFEPEPPTGTWDGEVELTH